MFYLQYTSNMYHLNRDLNIRYREKGNFFFFFKLDYVYQFSYYIYNKDIAYTNILFDFELYIVEVDTRN